ncbi:MAG TPA: EAL domain-containing protein, partial [Gammaproteobacteria bacterium]|nr:EAL domain-containing protein [Gammaproteobacteria bacterium]
SPYQLRTDCTTRLKEIFRDSGFPAEFFEFEVTETLLVGDDGSSLQQLADIRTELGLRIAMDDFGTGHSSLSQLKLLPIGKLKIDRSFINDLPDDQNDAAIVKAIILMAHTLGLEVVAEGVETEAQQHFLCKSQCDHLQGFLYGRPMPAEAISDLLGRGQLRHGQLCDTK